MGRAVVGGEGRTNADRRILRRGDLQAPAERHGLHGFKTIGASGLNFAPVAYLYAYHTDRDIAPRVEAGTLNHEIANTIATVRALDAMEWTRPAEPPTFFDVFGTRAIVYGDTAGRVLMGSALLVAALAWLLVARDLWRLRGILWTGGDGAVGNRHLRRQCRGRDRRGWCAAKASGPSEIRGTRRRTGSFCC